jgi:hypothetical protein
MKALHEFKTEQLYKDYLVIYFSSQFVSSGIVPDRIVVDMITQLVDKMPMNRPKAIRSERETKTIVERKKDFILSLQPFLKDYGKDMLNDFYSYWTEETKDKEKFRMELEKTWTLERRLKNWKNNNNGFNKTQTLPTLQGTI